MATTKKSTSRRGKGLPRRAQDLSKLEFLLALQKKKECNARALKIVEGMLEPNVKEDWFLDVLQHINQSHLQDVIEERAIIKLCGYALCSNKLKDIPSQQYRISTKLNKVYDIQERKNFCSNKCFKAHKFIKEQMPSSPLWLRDNEPVVKFSLMPSSESCGGAGDEVIVQVERVSKEEIKQLSGEEFKTSSVSQISLADVLHDLHAVTSPQADKSSKLQEHFENDRKDVGKEEETAVVTTEKTYSERQVQKQSSSNLSKNQSCLKIEETKNTSQDITSIILPDTNLSKINGSEILSGVKKVSINDQCQEKNICQKPTVSTKVEYPVKLGDGVSIPPVDEKDGEKIKEMKSNKEVKNGIDKDCSNTVESEKITTSTPVESENQWKVEGPAIPKPETSKPSVPSLLEGNIKTQQKKKKQQVESNSPHHNLSSIVSHVEKCLEEWFTMDTMCFLFGESALKDMLEQKGESIQAHYNALGTVTWDQEKHERFLAICKRLSLLDIEDKNFDNQVRSEGEKRKPLPDYNALKREAESMELKVKAFYGGNMEIEEKKVTFAKDTKSTDDGNIDEHQPQIPLVHLHSQRALRKRIVLDGLNRVLPDFLRTFGMRPSDMTASIRGLVGTFALSSTNITFKPPEWSLLGLILIKLLALREPELKRCLQHDQSNTYLTLMLMSYKQEPGYLEHLLSWLTDIDKLLARPKDSEERT